MNQAQLEAFVNRIGETDSNFDLKHDIDQLAGYEYFCELISAIREDRWSDIDRTDQLFQQYVAAFAAEDKENG